ncbi:GH12236 [Drosophila grimshawi]|uniref:GH12236 n=1 Tax=Drosophila grimshawi TaxID=7222 RepID=B4K292_DROGR|nr:GH12236 [Drosophila grimshawi]
MCVCVCVVACASCLCCDVGNKFIFITQDEGDVKDVGGVEGAAPTIRRHAYKVLYGHHTMLKMLYLSSSSSSSISISSSCYYLCQIRL